MICSNRKTRVFDLSRHETIIARQSDITIHLLRCHLLPRDVNVRLTHGLAGELIGNFSLYVLPRSPYILYIHESRSGDDHSYFVRWKLPTEALVVLEVNKWLRLSSFTTSTSPLS